MASLAKSPLKLESLSFAFSTKLHSPASSLFIQIDPYVKERQLGEISVN